jgi:hypothetical protein
MKSSKKNIFNRFCVAGCAGCWFLEDLVILFQMEKRPRRIFSAPPWSALFLMLSNINRQKPFRPEILLLDLFNFRVKKMSIWHMQDKMIENL